MAIKARDQIKWVTASKTLELEADTGEAFLIRDVMVYDASGNYITISIDKTTVGYFRGDSSNLGNHLHFPVVDSEKKTLLGFLWDKGIFKGYPVAEGQTFILSSVSSVYMAVLYDIYEPGDIATDMENGSEAKEYMLINYGRAATSGNLVDGDNEYDICMLPSEFPNFPYGKDVPAKTTITIYGILASDIGKTSGSGSHKQVTQYIKLVKEREVLFDEDKQGLLLRGLAPASDSTTIGTGYAVVGNYSSTDMRAPLIFSEPLMFASGEELTVIMNTSVMAGSANISVALGELAIIEKVTRAG